MKKELYFIEDRKTEYVMVNAYLKHNNENVGYFIYEYFMNDTKDYDFQTEDDKTMILKFIEIHDNHKYSGFGRQLMKELIDNHFKKQNKVNNITLEARPFNSDMGLTQTLLINFYEKFGFQLLSNDLDNYKIMRKLK